MKQHTLTQQFVEREDNIIDNAWTARAEAIWQNPWTQMALETGLQREAERFEEVLRERAQVTWAEAYRKGK